MDLETIIYIVVGIIWVIGSFLKQSKKAKKNKNPMPSNTSKPTGGNTYMEIQDLVNSFKEQMSENNAKPQESYEKQYYTEPVEQQTVSTNYSFNEQKEPSIDTIEDSVEYLTREDLLKKMQKEEHIKANKNTNKHPIAKALQEKDEIKKAIIYSIVLQRPHY